VPQPLFVEETFKTLLRSAALRSKISTVTTRPPVIEKSK